MQGFKHGFSRTRIYSEWHSMKGRCYTKTHTAYKNYGAKGITVCDEWKCDFLAFYNWAMQNGYNDTLTLDRIDSTKGYSPNNCKWATYAEQNNHLAMLKTNKSGYKGVSWSKKARQWICIISINNKSHRIGCYNTQKEAVEARNKYIDDHGLVNHQKNVYTGEKIIMPPKTYKYRYGVDHPMYGKHPSKKTREKLSKSLIGKAKGKHWYNNGTKCVFCKDRPKGFVLGRLTKK